MSNNNSIINDEEDDYMSTAILEQAAEMDKKLRTKTYSERRREQLREQQKKAYIKPRKQLEQEAREQGLQKKMTDDNKGMKMMLKMGFKQGSALGKESQVGIHEPLGVQLKQDRSGLGMDSLLKRKRDEQAQEELEKRKKLDMDPEQFRELMATKAKKGKRSRQINAAAHLCKERDESKGINANILWVLIPKKSEDQEEEEDQDEYQENKETTNENDHGIYPDEEMEELKSLPLDDQLTKIVDYLRTQHNYCFWCAAQYENENDLDTHCPGLTEEEH
ncbi:uncharacterized protein BX664DRAFT_300805 [Halteromyces radiatus]|uniref:uncharacterized protein n=1 Tax=Halteromyces radiatus TaxID=101107 RepID=UPI00221F8EDB|nr:uncharacterized protein BX664DRAFT_300805 [Halteromyces radiatus]KAI8085083.1 hypothetical protein BX664DRAFT_300805 [Halteromyces radiatus]